LPFACYQARWPPEDLRNSAALLADSRWLRRGRRPIVDLSSAGGASARGVLHRLADDAAVGRGVGTTARGRDYPRFLVGCEKAEQGPARCPSLRVLDSGFLGLFRGVAVTRPGPPGTSPRGGRMLWRLQPGGFSRCPRHTCTRRPTGSSLERRGMTGGLGHPFTWRPSASGRPRGTLVSR